jgi:hypothetical protein
LLLYRFSKRFTQIYVNQKNLHCEHPRYDTTGERCVVEQEGPVWFLTDSILKWKSTVTRTCTIPAEKVILFPILSGECDYGEPGIYTDSLLHQCAIGGNEFGVIEATIDGVELQDQNLKQYRIQSDFFNIKIVGNNIYGVATGTFRAMVDGFFV